MGGTHERALVEETNTHLFAEAKEKVALNQARLVCYKSLKVIPQQKLRFHQLRQSLTSQNHSY